MHKKVLKKFTYNNVGFDNIMSVCPDERNQRKTNKITDKSGFYSKVVRK